MQKGVVFPFALEAPKLRGTILPAVARVETVVASSLSVDELNSLFERQLIAEDIAPIKYMPFLLAHRTQWQSLAHCPKTLGLNVRFFISEVLTNI